MMKPDSIKFTHSIYRMKRLLTVLVGLSLLISCSPGMNNNESEEGESGSYSLVISGLPSERIKPYTSFILKANSPSEGYIDFKSSDRSLATVTLAGKHQYTVVTGYPDVEKKEAAPRNPNRVFKI